jgi:hypothetical protein
MTLGSLMVFLLVQTAGVEAAPEIDARAWFNLPEYRLHDEREAVLFFFESSSEECARLIPRLNRLRRKADTVVIGLSAEAPKTLEPYIHKHKIRFCVGAGSDSAKKYNITKFPTIIRLRGDRRAAPVILEQSEFDAYSPGWGQDEEEALRRLEDVADLKAFIESAADNRGRQTACEKLYRKLPVEEFAAYAEEALAVEGNPYVRRSLEFLLGRPSDEAIRSQTDLPPSTGYEKTYEDNSKALEWKSVRGYCLGTPVREREVPQLIEEFRQHPSEEPEDIVIRKLIARALNGRPAEARATLRTALFEFIPREKDYGIRLYLAGALMDQTQTGDEELAAFYEAQAARETSLLRLKPFLEYSAFAIRNGFDKLGPDDMEPPAKP